MVQEIWAEGEESPWPVTSGREPHIPAWPAVTDNAHGLWAAGSLNYQAHMGMHVPQATTPAPRTHPSKPLYP